MIIPLDVIIFVILIVTAILALSTKDLLAAVALLAGYSLFTAILFAGVTAVDVALVEAALGAGLTGILFVAAIMTTTRRSNPRLEVRRRYVVTPLIVAVLALLLYASTGLPDRGDPDAPAQRGISVAYLTRSLDDTNTPNVVTSLLADYRSMDTLGETLVILTASLSAALVLVRRGRDEEEDELPEGAGDLTASTPDGDEPGPEVGP
ncbi:MAG: hydrogen gas-evolving membrane-bound hydrogenase subunit E [Nitriliruptoraceae bacterium]